MAIPIKTRFTLILFSTLGLLSSAYAQFTPSADAYTNTATPTKNFGANTLLDVQSASQTTYIRFDLSAIPAGYTSANIAKATLKLYVNSVTTAGSFNVDFVNGAWSENTITANNAPALGTTIAASVPLTTAEKNQYVLIDVSSAVQDWLSGSQPNDGVALVGNSPLNATFDSKENSTTSHAADLDIVFAGITGVTTASVSGLTGGGTSGTLNLSLNNTCAANQVLQWNGSAWVCSNSGTGTVTSAGLTAPWPLSVSGSPVTGSGTLGLTWAVTPTAANAFNAIVQRDSAGGFSAGNVSVQTLYAQDTHTNTFTANKSILTNLLTVNNQINVPLPGANAITATSPAPNAYTIYGVASSSTGHGWGVEGVTAADSGGVGVAGIATSTATSASSVGVYGVASSSTGHGWGVGGVSAADGGVGVAGFATSTTDTGHPFGVWGQATPHYGYGVVGQDGPLSVTGQGYLHPGYAAGTWGDGGTSGATGVLGTADDGTAGWFVNNTSPGGATATVYIASNSPYSNPLEVYGPLSGGYCYIDGSGNLHCTGTKQAVVPIDGGVHTVGLSAIESPQNWFEDFGSAQLVGGSAVIALDPDFIQTVNTTEEYQVFLTPYGDCGGLYVSNRTANSFEVHELGGRTTTLSFGYRIAALRRKYEKVRFEDRTHDLDGVKRMQERMKKAAGQNSASHVPEMSPLPVSASTAALPVTQRTNLACAQTKSCQ